MTISLTDAANLIRRGGLVAFPTETVYGLGANAFDAAAVAKIFDLKGRPSTSPLIVHVASIDMARKLAARWPPLAEQLAQKYWPGPLTMVLEKSREIPDIVTAGLPTVGLRMPDHPIALELIEAAGVPIAAPSANRFTHLSPTSPDHVREEFGDAVAILDGGSSRVGIESTVVSIHNGALTLLRPGLIRFDEIEPSRAPEPGAHSLPHPAPGMHPRHYSPATPVLLVNHPNELPDRKGAYVWRQESGITSRSVRMPRDPERYANRLYSVLHELDREHWPWIAVEIPPDRPEWAAIRDRLRRASVKR